MTEVADSVRVIAASRPLGPVHVSLPREVLCEAAPAEGLDRPPQMQPTTAYASAAQIRQAAQIMAEAERLVIFAQHGAASP